MRRAYLWVFWVILSLGWGQQTPPVNLDYFARVGGCEFDINKDGLVDGFASFVEGGVSEALISLSLDNAVRYAGTASQRIRLQKNSGAGGRFVLFRDIDWNAVLKPSVGEPLRVQIALRAENFQNATYGVIVRTGDRSVELVPHTSENLLGWQVFTMVVPVEANSQGDPSFRLSIEIRAQEGFARGTLWIDELRAISSATVQRRHKLPNGLKLCYNFLYPNRDPMAYLSDYPFGMMLGVPENAPILLRHYPDTRWAPYTSFIGASVHNWARHSSDLYGYDDLVQNHPDWFLLDANGERIYNSDGFYYVDIGLPEVQNRALERLHDLRSRVGNPKLVYLDNVQIRFGEPVGQRLLRYPTNAEWTQAVNSWFLSVGRRAQQEFGNDFGFILNVALGPGYWLKGIPGISDDAPGVVTLPYVKGFLLEHFATHARANPPGNTTVLVYGSASGSFGPNNWTNWKLRDQIRLASEYPDKIVILIPTFWVQQYEGQPNAQERIRFAIGMCLLVQHENTYIHLDPRREQENYPTGFYPPELFIPLGNPVGGYRIQNGDIITGGLFIRDYENGMVLVNPTPDRDFTFTVPRDLYDWDRRLVRAGTQVTIARQTALVLWSAPEISLSITQDKTQVLPGETVQFTVTYRNTGTAPGTNVKIAVPLPEGMTLTGSNPPASFENGQVVWTIPNIPVNGTGTLRFTVRVE